jgi:hypothetical protein
MTAGLVLWLGCGTTTGVHRPLTVSEGQQINDAAAAAGQLEVEYDPPSEDPAGPVFPLKAELDEAQVASSDLHNLTITPANGPPLVLPLDRVRSVSAVSHGQGGKAGGFLGGAAALVGGILVGSAMAPNQNENCEMFCGHGGHIVAMTALLAVIMIPVGTLVGAAVGQRQTFTFGDVPDAPRAAPADSWSP